MWLREERCSAAGPEDGRPAALVARAGFPGPARRPQLCGLRVISLVQLHRSITCRPVAAREERVGRPAFTSHPRAGGLDRRYAWKSSAGPHSVGTHYGFRLLTALPPPPPPSSPPGRRAPPAPRVR